MDMLIETSDLTPYNRTRLATHKVVIKGTLVKNAGNAQYH
jgi:hypothetical protein